MMDDNTGQEATLTPRPDPTERTKEELRREVDQLEKTVDLRTQAVDERLKGQIRLTESRLGTAKRDRKQIRKEIDDKRDDAARLSNQRLATLAERVTGVKNETRANEIAAAAHLQAEITWTGERFKSVEIAQAAAVHAGEAARSGDRELFKTQIDAMREMLNERYQTQTKALDAAFVAQQAAVATSFDASEKAMAAALLAAKEAVEKANVATEKRFDNVTALLSQQNSTLSLLLPRNEAEARLKALDDKYTDLKSAVDKGFTGTDTRSAMGSQYWGFLVGFVGIVSMIVTLAITLSR